MLENIDTQIGIQIDIQVNDIIYNKISFREMYRLGGVARMTSSGLGCTSNALKPSTSDSSLDVSFATSEARPA